MKHIFETTVRGLVKHYSSYLDDNILIEDDKGVIRIKDGSPEEYLKIVSHGDMFVLSLFSTDTYTPEATVTFCDGVFGLSLVGRNELIPASIGGYWAVRDVFNAINALLKTHNYNNLVFDTLLSLADTVDLEVSSVLLGIVGDISKLPHGDKEESLMGNAIMARAGYPNQSTHTLKIIGGDVSGTYTLEFDIGVYLIDEPVSINQELTTDSSLSIEYTGNIYKDIRRALTTVLQNSVVKHIENNDGVNFTGATLQDLINLLSKDVVSKKTDTAPVSSSGDEAIIKEFSQLVLATERYDLSMYIKHQGSHEAVLFSKVNGDELPLFRLTILDGIVVTKFNFPSLKVQVTVVMLPSIENTLLDKVTVILEDDVMYKRGVITIHSIRNNVTGIMNASNIALSHAVSAQYGKFDSILPNLDPILNNLVEELHLSSKVIYPIC